jgi:hypothetical protein
MNTSIFSAAMSVDSNGSFGTSGHDKGNTVRANKGIKSLVEMYKVLFRIPENLDHYSESDYRTAERRFLKYALEHRQIDIKNKPLSK